MNDTTNHTPEDIRDTARALDRLAQADAASAPAGLHDRIFMRTAASLRDPAAQDISTSPAPAPIPLWHRPIMRTAAVIAFVVIASLFFITPTQQPGIAEADTDEILEQLDSILALAYEPDPFPDLDALDTELSELFASDSLDNLDTWLESEEAL